MSNRPHRRARRSYRDLPVRAIPGAIAMKVRSDMKARPLDAGLDFFRNMDEVGILDLYCRGLEQPNGSRMVEALVSRGAPEREITRYLLYTGSKGEGAMSVLGSDCVFFAPVSCGDDNCLDPDHQRLTTNPSEQITW